MAKAPKKTKFIGAYKKKRRVDGKVKAYKVRDCS